MLGCGILQPNTLQPNTAKRLPHSEAIEGTVYPLTSPIEDMGVDYRRADVPMPEQFLNGADVVAVSQ
jgi:hypothetical protein